MTIQARSVVSNATHSLECGRQTAQELLAGLTSPKLVATYLTVNHDAHAFLRGMSEVLGADIPVVGCSTQGVAGAGVFREEGFAAGALGLEGDSIEVSHASVGQIQVDTFEKGRSLGRALRSNLSAPPRCVVLHYDPLCGVDPEPFLDGLFLEVECIVVGGAAAHSFNYQAVQETFQFMGTEVLQQSAVAFAMSGDFTVETEICHGCSPVGVELTVTRAKSNVILEFDGRPAREVWTEICGVGVNDTGQTAALAIGVRADGADGATDYFVRAAYAMDSESGGVILGPAIPAGTTVMLHHRTVDEVLEGARRMGASLRQRLANKRIRAVFGFECGARTGPFLGLNETLKENIALQESIGQNPAWLGMNPWGEIYPSAGRPRFHNYSYPLLVLADG